jgi:GNAT superfamily N-acetyltransferase
MQPERLPVEIRDAQVREASSLARLADQLGYPTEIAQIESRLKRIDGRRDERVIVAADEGQNVLGWTTVRVVEHMYGDAFVEISGFVVDKEARGRGVGRKMMAEVERWAKQTGHSSIRLNANVARTGAHEFYKALGFEQIKQQIVFRKSVNE